ncbi:MAG TPA: PEP-CTERM sorting domain-containing protein, partial [Kiritimatiellia bacterium]
RKILLEAVTSKDQFPFMIVVGSGSEAVGGADDLSVPGGLVPDIDGYATYRNSELVGFTSWSGAAIAGRDRHPVFVFETDDGSRAVRADAGMTAVRIPGAAANPKLNAPAVTIPADSSYGKAVAAWLAYERSDLHPVDSIQELKDLVAKSRETGIMLPVTSYIVVENSAQWKMLKIKEDEKLEGSKALAFKETPEPGTWVMIIAGAGVIAFSRMSRRFRTLRLV